MTQFAIHQQTKTNRRFFEDLGSEDLGSKVPLEMVLIPSGTFLMGSTDDELERRDNEGPQHLVTVPTFFMGRYPITQEQWRAVAAMPRVERDLDPAPSEFKGDMRPVERVSWEDTMEFCARLSTHTKRSYSLPSEAEWEYACRAGTTTPFHFGETISPEVANYDGNYLYARNPEVVRYDGSSTYGDASQKTYRKETTLVGYFGVSNAFGLCDMHGNVCEWCLDPWHDNYEGAPMDGSVWNSDEQKDIRVLRGGSWLNKPRSCRSANRDYVNPASHYDYNVGFRIVCHL